jgi:hypothetical protein
MYAKSMPSLLTIFSCNRKFDDCHRIVHAEIQSLQSVRALRKVLQYSELDGTENRDEESNAVANHSTKFCHFTKPSFPVTNMRNISQPPH